MISRTVNMPPRYAYPVDPWRIVESRFSESQIPRTETIMALANGYLGMRGNLDEGAPADENGTFINAFYEEWPIVHPEEGFGFAKTGQTIVNVPDTKVINLYVDDEPFFLNSANLVSYERILDLRAGLVRRSVLWESPGGKRVRVSSTRLVSFEHRHLAVMSYSVTLLDHAAPVIISSKLLDHPVQRGGPHDPRAPQPLPDVVLSPETGDHHGHRVLIGYRTHESGMTLGVGVDHQLTTDCDYTTEVRRDAAEGKVVFTVAGQPDQPIELIKFAAYHTSAYRSAAELTDRCARTLNRAVRDGRDALVHGQRAYLDRFWERADIEIDCNEPEVQQAVRWNLFQVAQASARADGTGIPAKGLTGQAYEGHYFWDSETFVMPMLTFTEPRLARNLLMFRHGMLEEARERARQVNQKGALFAWRTINGEEASPYFEASTAQYHINADIVYAMRKYVMATGDTDFLYNGGAEILVETARLWLDLGFFAQQDGMFHIHNVTGPDEYTTLVNDNTFTNLMARMNLMYAADVVETMREREPARYEILADLTKFDPVEIEAWRIAGQQMYVPFNENRAINPQDEHFLQKEVWDFEGTPPQNYPLLLHYHPLVIYRFQVLKQADVVMAMFLLGEHFPPELMRNNFDYYDPLTTGDSSLSACIESIIAAEIGYPEKAMEYFRYALYMDLADLQGNVDHGVHVASAGGVWLSLVFGFAGLRQRDGRLSFDPRTPSDWRRIRFCLAYRGRSIEVELTQTAIGFTILRGAATEVSVRGEEISLPAGERVTVSLHPAGELEPTGVADDDGT